MITEIGEDIFRAKQFLDTDELVAIPTETVYGLAANALKIEAVSKIYLAKNRPSFNPLILHVGSKVELKKYVQSIPNKMERLIDTFMPGPLTILLPKSNLVPDIVTAGSSKVAIRIPNNQLTLDLLNQLDYPLAAPSANISGFTSPTSAKHVLDSLEGKIPYILNGGNCQIGIESTIVGYDDMTHRVILYRLGGLSIESIEACIGEAMETKLQHSSPETPGQLKNHYATTTPMYLGDLNQLIQQFDGKRIVVIRFSDEIQIPVWKQYVLSKSKNTIEAAQNLFSTLREADNQSADVILAEYVPEEELGLAINDRLRRASLNNDG